MLCEFAKLQRANISSSCLSVPLFAWNISAPTGRIFMAFDTWVFFENLSRKLKSHWNLTRIMNTLHEYQYTFLIVSRSIILWIRNFSDESCRESQSKHFMLNNFFFKSCSLWHNVEKYSKARQATDNKMTHAHFMLYT